MKGTKMFEKNPKVTKSTKSTQAETAATDSSAAAATSARGQSTTIGASIRIKGELSGGEDLVIQGNVEGTIKLKDNSVSVGEHGRIQADVYAKSITIHGELSGDLYGTQKVTVARSGKVTGNIIAPRVVLEDGATFKGSIDMDNKPAATTMIAERTETPTKASSA
jgi:cytoskeletal protein CcmA (bactofilin family)